MNNSWFFSSCSWFLSFYKKKYIIYIIISFSHLTLKKNDEEKEGEEYMVKNYSQSYRCSSSSSSYSSSFSILLFFCFLFNKHFLSQYSYFKLHHMCSCYSFFYFILILKKEKNQKKKSKNTCVGAFIIFYYILFVYLFVYFYCF